MSDLLAKAREMVETASKQAETEARQEKYERSKRKFEEIKVKYAELSKKLEDVKKKHGNPTQKHKDALDEIARLRKQGQEVNSHLEMEELEKILSEAKQQADLEKKQAISEIKEIEEQHQDASSEMKHLGSLFQKSKDDLEALGKEVFSKDTSNEIKSLREEMELTEREFPSWIQLERHAILEIWAGKGRKIQKEKALSKEDDEELYVIFGIINRLSNEYKPGWVDALNRNFETDWDVYIKDAQAKFQDAMSERLEQEKKKKQQEEINKQLERQKEEERINFNKAVQVVLDDLESLIKQDERDDKAVHEKAKNLLDMGLKANDDRLLVLVEDFSDEEINNIFSGKEFRSLRKQVVRLKQEDSEYIKKNFPKVIPFTKGKRVIITGGIPREERRKQIEEAFEFKSVDWEDCEHGSPRMLSAITERIKRGSYDMILHITSFIGHHWDEELSEACKVNPACRHVRVRHGYGLTRLAHAIDRFIGD